MLHQSRAVRAVATALIGGVVALNFGYPAFADADNPVNRMGERTSPGVNLVGVEYSAKAQFSYTYYTDEGIRLRNHALRLYQRGSLGSTSEAATAIFDRIRKDPTRYLAPFSTKAYSHTFKGFYSGSSFTASEDGYLVTARHVVTATGDVKANFVADASGWATKADAASWRYILSGWHLSSAAKRSMKAAVSAYHRTTIKVNVGKPKVTVYLRTATASGATDFQAVPADVVYRSGTAAGEDVAVLRVRMPGIMYSLGLADQPAQQGDTVFINAYPKLADRSLKAMLTSSVTQGQITAIKTNHAGLDELQTNAIATRGASGGAAVNSEGEVIGILVSGVPGAGENYLMPLESIRDALARSGATPKASQTTELYLQALDHFHGNHYSVALEEFNRVKALYPAHAYVDSFITRSQVEISAGHDVPLSPPTPPVVESEIPWTTVMIVGAIVLALGGAGTAIVLIRRMRATRPGGDPSAATAGGQPEYDLGQSDETATAAAWTGATVFPLAAVPDSSAQEQPTAAEGGAGDPTADGQEDEVDDMPEEWEPLDYVPGFPPPETRQAS